MKHDKNHTLILLIAFILMSILPTYGQEYSKEDVAEALRDGADCACNVILNESGKSRCDYNILEGKWYEYEPPWHTGQLIYGLVETYKITKNAKYLECAQRAGDWWVSLEITDHPRLKGMVRSTHGDRIGDVIVFATMSDGSAGLYKLYEVTENKKYADVPTRAGEWMLEHMYVPEHGVFYDAADPNTGEVLKENSPFWPDKKLQNLFDVSRPNNEGSLYKDMYEYTGDEKYKKVFIELCESLVEKQGPEGLWMDFMPNHKDEGSFHPRFNLWYAESLLEGYDLTGDERFLNAALKTARFYTKYQSGDGTFYYKNYLNGKSNKNSISGSTVAFAGILWMRLIGYGVGDEFKDNVERSLEWVIKNRFANDHPDPNLAGMFYELRTRHKKGKLWVTIRDVATSFGMRFLADYYHYKYEN